MSASRWGLALLILDIVVGVTALPQQFFPSLPSSSLTFARQRRQLENVADLDDETLLCVIAASSDKELGSCYSPPRVPSSSSTTVTRETRQLSDSVTNKDLICLLLASDEGRDSNSCNIAPNETPVHPKTVTAVPVAPPGAIPPGDTGALPPVDSGAIPPVDSGALPPVDPGAIPPVDSGALPPVDSNGAAPPSCRCVPHWQCNDGDSSKVVEGDDLTSFVLDLRGNFGCGAPEEVCCEDVNVSSPPPSVPSVTPLCGERNSLGVGNTFLGFEDRQSQFGEFPWTAAVISSRGFGPDQKPVYIGGGSLIHPQAVLTVAHNMLNYTADLLKVRLGEWNLATQTEVTPHQELHVQQVLYHPRYHKVHQYYDVALLLLESPAVLGATVNTICLPSPHVNYVSNDCVVSGWGKKEFTANSRYQKVMKKVLLPLVDHAQCQAALQGTRLGPRFILDDSFVCAGGQKKGQDACTGDGGSPLVCPMQSDPHRYVQVGVVAWGIGCGKLGLPGVYADVMKARPWIHEVIHQTFGDGWETKEVPFDLRIFEK